MAPDSSGSRSAWYVGDDGDLYDDSTHNSAGVVPAVYLKSETSISSGNGSESEPYVIG